jgi:glycerol kinase
MSGNILAIDQGTTSSRAIVFNERQAIAGIGKMEFTQHFPQDGWVEHVPEEIWATSIWSAKTALKRAGLKPTEIAAIGITNQRETTIVWDRATGKAIHNAIVWQDRRTHKLCDKLKRAGHEPTIAKKTGLLLDPYFSATKLAWILDNVPGARKRAEKGELAFGTVDSYLIWRLTGGKSHATDVTNACRTLLFNIKTNAWDDELLALFRIPRAILPEVKDNADDFGVTDPEVLGAAIPICGSAGDQQAATIGQACFTPGMLKSTYGTGCFALLNTGADLVRSKNRLLTTSPTGSTARRPTRSRAPSSLPAPRCNGCAICWGCSRNPRMRGRSPPRPTRRRTSIWCRPSPGSGRRGGMPRRAPRSPGSPAIPDRRNWRARRSSPSPTRRAT